MSPTDRGRWQELIAALRGVCAVVEPDRTGERVRVIVDAGGHAAGLRLLAGDGGAWVDLVVRLGPPGTIDELALVAHLADAPVGGLCMLADQLCLRQTAPLAGLTTAAVRDLLVQLVASARHAAPPPPAPIPYTARAAVFSLYAA